MTCDVFSLLLSVLMLQHGEDSLSSEQSLARVDPSRNMDAKLENSLLTGPSKESQVSPRGQRNNAWHDVLEICKKGFANKMSTLASFEKFARLFTPLKMFYWVLKFGSCTECLVELENAVPGSMSDEILAEVRLEVDQSATALRKDVAETRQRDVSSLLGFYTSPWGGVDGVVL